MSNLDNDIMTIWLVQLGKLFYSGGLTREPSNDESFSYEFVKDEEVAFCFYFEDIAESIADKCGGKVVERTLPNKEYRERSDKRDVYMESEKKVVAEFKKQMLLEIVQQPNPKGKKPDKMVELLKESFLLPFIERGLNEFEYSDGIFYAGLVGEPLHQTEKQPDKEVLIKLVEMIAETDQQTFNWKNPHIKVVAHPSIYLTAQLDTFHKGELKVELLVKEEFFN